MSTCSNCANCANSANYTPCTACENSTALVNTTCAHTANCANAASCANTACANAATCANAAACAHAATCAHAACANTGMWGWGAAACPLYTDLLWQQQTQGASCSRWVQPISTCTAQYANAAQYSNAGTTNGGTLVIHQIVLNACGGQDCTPRTFHIRVTGPSYPCGEIFHLRAGSCLELDEPLVLTGLLPGTYRIEEIYACPNEYISTYTGPVCGRRVTVTNSYFPTVITIVCRKRLCSLCSGYGCGASAATTCG